MYTSVKDQVRAYMTSFIFLMKKDYLYVKIKSAQKIMKGSLKFLLGYKSNDIIQINLLATCR